MRFSILCILYIFIFRVYISGIASISAKSKLNEASQHVSDIELSNLQSKMVRISAENNNIKELLDILSQSKTSAQLDLFEAAVGFELRFKI